RGATAADREGCGALAGGRGRRRRRRARGRVGVGGGRGGARGASLRAGRRAERCRGPRGRGARLMATDVLVIGSGIGGLSVALEAAKFGRVLVVTKKRAQDANTNYAQGGIAAVFEETDSFAEHVRDTLRTGAGLSVPAVVREVVARGPDRVRALEAMGVPFNRESGAFSLGREGGHSHRRIVHASDF